MTEQHVPVERLAAYAAGDLDADAALEVEAHLAITECRECQADLAALQRVSSALAGVEQVTMPADVAARVDVALAQERAAAGAASPAGPPADGGPVGDVLPMAPRRRMPSFAGLAAAAAGIALVAAVSVPLVTGGGEQDAGTLAESAPGAAVQTRRLDSGLNYAASGPEQALLDALAGRRRAAFGETAADAASPPPAAAPSGGVKASPEGAPKAAVGVTTQTDTDYAALRTDAARLASCLRALSEGVPAVARTPLIVDFATFEGRPAMIAVFPTVSKGQIRPDRVDFWAVGPRCGITPGDDDVMHFARFPRPEGL